MSGRGPLDAPGRRAWLAQAAGVFRATRTTQARPQATWSRWTGSLLAQAGLFAVAALAAASATPAVPLPAGLVLLVPGLAIVALVVLQLAALQAAENDVVREVEARTLDVLAFSPLPCSALLAGKLAVLHWNVTSAFLGLLPVLALAWAVSALSLASIVGMFLVLHAGTLAHGAWLLGEALRSGARRKEGKRVVSRWAGLLSGMTVLAGLFLLPVLASVQISTGPTAEATPWIVLLSLLPATALLAASPFAMPLISYGRDLAPWVPALAVLLVAAPLTLGTALARWKPARSATGLELRAGMAALVALLSFVVLGSVPGGDAEHAATLTGLSLFVLFVVLPWAACSELADRAAHLAAARAPWVMRRGTLAGYMALCLGLVALCCALAADPLVTAPWAVSVFGLAASLPAAAAIGATCLMLPRARAAAWAAGLGALCLSLLLSAAPSVASMSGAAPAGSALAVAADVVASLSPLTSIHAAAQDLSAATSNRVGVETARGFVPAWLVGGAAQAAFAALVLLLGRALERRRATSRA